MNQARSPFSQALLTQHFPEHEFMSTGIEAITGAPYMAEVRKFAQTWGIEMPEGFSVSLADAKQSLAKIDLAIAATKDMVPWIEKSGIAQKIISCEELLSDPMFKPNDPEGLGLEEAKTEVAKVGALSIRAMLESLDMHTVNKIIAVVPQSEIDIPKAVEYAMSRASLSPSLVLSADFRVPINEEELGKSGAALIPFDLQDLFSGTELPFLENTISVHSREVNDPEKIYFSTLWRETLERLSRNHALIVITAPRKARNRSLPDSYIVAALADEFIVIADE